MSDIPGVPPEQAAAVAAILKPTDALFAANRRTRRWVKVAVAMALLAVLAAGFAIAGLIKASDAQRRTNAVARTAKLQSAQLARVVYEQTEARCELGNDFRRGDAELWGKIFSFAPAPNETPAQAALREQRTAEVKSIIDKHDALIDCSKVP